MTQREANRGLRKTYKIERSDLSGKWLVIFELEGRPGAGYAYHDWRWKAMREAEEDYYRRGYGGLTIDP